MDTSVLIEMESIEVAEPMIQPRKTEKMTFISMVSRPRAKPEREREEAKRALRLTAPESDDGEG